MLGKKAYLKVLLDLGFWKLSMWIERECETKRLWAKIRPKHVDLNVLLIYLFCSVLSEQTFD